MKILGIIGAGELGYQIAQLALQSNVYAKYYFFDDYNIGANILGKISDVESAYSLGKFDELIIAIGYNHLKFKEDCFNKFFNKIPFAKVIHPSAHIDESATIGDGSVIYPHVIIEARTQIKENVLINTDTFIAHDIIIGSHSFLSARIAIAGFTEVGMKNFVGINATIIDNLKICDNCIIGAGSTVIKNITRSGLHAGNPARFIK